MRSKYLYYSEDKGKKNFFVIILWYTLWNKMNKYASNRLICDFFTLFQELKNYFKIKI